MTIRPENGLHKINHGGMIDDDGLEVIEPSAVDAYCLEVENLSDAIRGAAEPLLDREDAVGQARTLEALFRSGELAAPVTL